tara:strand:- start:25577 stop:25942 length:366 start_codon:yes stop_codon:yes gene_type:complete
VNLFNFLFTEEENNMFSFSKQIRERVAPIEDQREREQIATLLDTIERYANGEVDLDQMGHFTKAVCLGYLAEAYFRADDISRKHLKHILWFCEWDVPRDRLNLPQKMYDTEKRMSTERGAV